MKSWLAWLSLNLAAAFPGSGEPAERAILFLCTGNYFRSAFAEHYFNHLAAQNRRLEPGDPRRKRVAWRAESRGLDIDQLTAAQRAARMSRHAQARLRALQVALPLDAAQLPAHTPTPLALPELGRFDRVIAMHAPSHRPMLRRLAAPHQDRADLLGRVTYWHIDDVNPAATVRLSVEQQAGRALDAVERAVRQLFERL